MNETTSKNEARNHLTKTRSVRMQLAVKGHTSSQVCLNHRSYLPTQTPCMFFFSFFFRKGNSAFENRSVKLLLNKIPRFVNKFKLWLTQKLNPNVVVRLPQNVQNHQPGVQRPRSHDVHFFITNVRIMLRCLNRIYYLSIFVYSHILASNYSFTIFWMFCNWRAKLTTYLITC